MTLDDSQSESGLSSFRAKEEKTPVNTGGIAPRHTQDLPVGWEKQSLMDGRPLWTSHHRTPVSNNLFKMPPPQSSDDGDEQAQDNESEQNSSDKGKGKASDIGEKDTSQGTSGVLPDIPEDETVAAGISNITITKPNDPSFPQHGKTYMIKSKSTGLVITLHRAMPHLYPMHEYGQRASEVWDCEIRDGFFYFKNPVSERYLGYSEKGLSEMLGCYSRWPDKTNNFVLQEQNDGSFYLKVGGKVGAKEMPLYVTEDWEKSEHMRFPAAMPQYKGKPEKWTLLEVGEWA